MKLHCLGTAGYHPNDTRHTSCYFLAEHGILLDAGSGIFRIRDLLKTTHLDILLSHAHLDHSFGLTFLLDVLYESPVKDVRIWGQQDKLDAIREHVFAELMFPVELSADWIAIDETPEFRVGDFDVGWCDQPHPGGSVGYRLCGNEDGAGKKLVYLTDTTGVTEPAATRRASGADLMLHECYFRSSQSEWAEKTGHSWSGRVAEVAMAAKPKSLLLTHVNPIEPKPEELVGEVVSAISEAGLDRSDAIEVRLAADGDVIDF